LIPCVCHSAKGPILVIGRHIVMSNKYVYQIPDNEFISIVTSSSNIRQALVSMGLVPKGGNYQTFKNRCKTLGIKMPEVKKMDPSEKPKRESVTDQEIVSSCAQSIGRASTLKRLGLKENIRSNVLWIDSQIERLNIDTQHWVGQGHLFGKTHDWSNKLPIEELLQKDSNHNSHHLRSRLIKEGLMENICKECGILDWRGKSLSLHLDHINGDKHDNRLENLRLLCPNCHSQTETYCGKNKGH
jgi:hypothetical protein